ncbi:MAG: FAD-dependent oxidoreductase [Anaerolineae bacterium]
MFVVLGGGIAGLTAARELLRRGQRVVVIEKGTEVGGLARTFVRDGFRFDLGGHRFHSNNPSVVQWLLDLLGDDLLTVPRSSRIKINGRFVDYPLTLPGAFTAFPPLQGAQVAASYFLARFISRSRPDLSFEDWVVRRFGRAMYRHFFQPYTEKVWGISGAELSAEWAAQRIGLPGIWQAIRHSLRPAANPPATAVSQFHYPRAGFGMIPQALLKEIQSGDGVVLTRTIPTRITAVPDGFEVAVRGPDGEEVLHAAELISTIPLGQLLRLLPTGNSNIQAQARLHYRGLICLFLALNKERVTSDSWTYFPDPSFIFGRTHEPKNWSPQMVPEDSVTSLGVEIFATPAESGGSGPDAPIWSWPDEAIAEKAIGQFARLGWFDPAQVRDYWLLRLPHAYPIYDLGYRERLARVRAFLAQWPRLHLVGRTGSFRYMNSDGVIEDVFRFLTARFPGAFPGEKTAVQPIARENGRWA